MKMLTIRIPDELHMAFKLKCVAEGLDMNSVVTKWVESFVKGGKVSKAKKQK
jgi:hypothetical protein